jgi:hypothetical protein
MRRQKWSGVFISTLSFAAMALGAYWLDLFKFRITEAFFMVICVCWVLGTGLWIGLKKIRYFVRAVDGIFFLKSQCREGLFSFRHPAQTAGSIWSILI